MASAGAGLAEAIVRRLQGAGHVAYWAGGCVRDRIMGRAAKDYDVATSARPEEVSAIFPRSQQVGAAFGVILVREKRGGETAQVEVATFRAEAGYSDGRHPDSVRFTTAQEDAARRDFTCNGLFFDPVSGAMHDFVGGRADIEKKILRAIGDPAARFAEDHLRMLRAVRFAAKLEFEIEAGTFAAMQRLAGQIRTVSRERVHDELEKIVTDTSRARGAALLQETGLLGEIWPGVLLGDGARPRTWAALSALPADADFMMALIGMHRDVADAGAALEGPRVAQLLRAALLLSNTETEDLAWLLNQSKRLLQWETLSKAALKRVLANARWGRLEGLFLALDLAEAKRGVFAERVAMLRREGVSPEPFVTGNVLIGLGAAPGRKFKGWLEALYDRQLEGELTTREAAVAAAREMMAGGGG